MNIARKRKSVKAYDVKKEIRRVEKLFSDIRKDKTLPTFGEHVILCIIKGTSEKVNLKKMYPRLHKRLSTWLFAHNARTIALKK